MTNSRRGRINYNMVTQSVMSRDNLIMTSYGAENSSSDSAENVSPLSRNTFHLVKKVNTRAGSCSFSTDRCKCLIEKIMGGQSFNFAINSPKRGLFHFRRQIVYFWKEILGQWFFRRTEIQRVNSLPAPRK